MKNPEELVKEFCDEFEDYPSRRMLAALVISELEGQKKDPDKDNPYDASVDDDYIGYSDAIQAVNSTLDQRINEWKKLL